MNDKYFRYILKERNISIVELAKYLGLTASGLNYKIRHNTFFITDIFKILDMLGMEFPEVFKPKEEVESGNDL